jgi:propionyl-CoA synthetase
MPSLQDRVARLAGALRAKGVTKGDRVIIYMPMVPEALEAMLACARLGAIHSVVFGGFAANELAVRIDDCTPKAIIAASCGIEPNRVVHYKPLLDAAIDMADHKPDFCVILQREQEVAKLVEGRDVAWHEFPVRRHPAECVPVEGNHPAYILYTSGTTGAPKGVVRPTAGPSGRAELDDARDLQRGAGDVFWAASDVGWVVGHSYICYAPLIAGCTTIVYEGKPVGTPDAGLLARDQRAQGQILLHRPHRPARHQARRPRGQAGPYDLSHLQALYLAGERADPDTIQWAAAASEGAGDRPLVADRNRLCHRRQPLGIEPLPVKIGSPFGGDARL